MRKEFSIEAEGRIISKALASIRKKASNAGYNNVQVYFEASGDLHVLDLDHANSKLQRDLSVKEEGETSITHVGILDGFDCGAFF